MRSIWKRPYHKIDDEKDGLTSGDELSSLSNDSDNDQIPGSRGHRAIVYILALSIGLNIILSAITLWYTISHSSSSSLKNHRYHNGQDEKPQRVCGDTATEALSLGCTLDPMTWSWLSPSCPRYASSEFETSEELPYKYYVDPYNLVLAEGKNWTLALDNQVRLYAERREHVTHCVYTFLSLAQIIRDGTQTHPRLSAYEHIQHCVEIVLESVRRDRDWHTVDADMGEVSFDEGC
ncbi:hypothetical protein BKA67DRAFT_529594 [Truncatella angustata]|uniref:DUF3328 domain containing protein n=1 Tax=Truncatella angustata TaxID=152316 RepID=A0A9P8UVT0_9PEZI|nr:uncharacterized protein BKA67DRAFT_529594 [Truncatella angustata]KAH6659441.1 hypothetical protein BKA67DRAFT_529594 [Truncatella angustata]KAH8205554.1 hypothetical protein TruAng_000260 [Truncatella angustata]